MTNKELDIQGCKKFVCPNLDMIDDMCKGEIAPEMIEKTKQLAIEYIKKTYHHPKYPSIKRLFPAFLFITMNIGINDKGERFVIKERHKNAISKGYCGLLFGVCDTTVANYVSKITEELNIEYHGAKPQYISGKTILLKKIGDVSWLRYQVKKEQSSDHINTEIPK